MDEAILRLVEWCRFHPGSAWGLHHDPGPRDAMGRDLGGFTWRLTISLPGSEGAPIPRPPQRVTAMRAFSSLDLMRFAGGAGDLLAYHLRDMVERAIREAQRWLGEHEVAREPAPEVGVQPPPIIHSADGDLA